MRNTWWLVFTLFAAAPCLGADTYPSQTVRVIVPFAPGSTVDNTARVVSQRLTEQFGRQFVVENRAGAGAIIGNEYVARSAPDGYTLLMAEPSFTVLPSMKKSLPYDTLRDFTPVTLIVRQTNALVIIPSLNINTLREFIAAAQANPGKFNYGSGGTGSATHLWSELFKNAAKVNITHVPYKGSSDVVNAMLGGQVQMLITTIPTFLAHVKSGRLRALAVTTDGKRSPSMPDVPSMTEAGVSGMSVYGWQGLVGPAGMPRDIVNRLQAEVAKALALPAVRDPFVAQAGEVAGTSPEEFSAYIRSELPRWAEVIKSAGITPE